MIQVVIDTCVLAAAFRNRTGAGAALLSLAASERLAMCVSSALFLEYEAVLKRPEQRAVSGLSLSAVDDILNEMAEIARPVDVHIRWRPQLRDVADEMVLEAAINASVDALVTFNLRDFAEAAPRFGLRVLTPGILLTEMRR